MTYTIFYSWQSDTSRKINRDFIEDALNNAILNLRKDCAVPEALREGILFDQGTEGVPGNPPIPETIRKKIQTCSIFVADITFVGQSNNSRLIPNPNVLIEYGNALETIGENRSILIMNTVFGAPISGNNFNMPFDIRHFRNPITYHLKENASPEKYARTKDKLSQDLTEAIQLIINKGELNDLIRKKQALTCRFCGTHVEFGRTVCIGCNAEIVYGATKQEIEQAFGFGLLGGGVLCSLLLSELPKWLASDLGWPLVSGWGLGDYIFWPGAALISLTIVASIYMTDNSYRKGKPRFFRSTIV
jgi:hypothetical protein